MNDKKEARRRYYLQHREHERATNREWLKRNRARCTERAGEWTRTNRVILNARKREVYAKDRNLFLKRSKRRDADLRARLFDIYGSECACCHEKDKRFLSLGHVKNDGYLDRQKFNGNARTMYLQAIKNPDPTRYEIQCFNCNLGARINSGICPHKTKQAGGS